MKRCWRKSFASWAVRALTVAMGVTPVSRAADCHAASTWPKMIGYGLKTSQVIHAARCSTNGKLALAIFTEEGDLVGKATPRSGNTNPLMVTSFDPSTEKYDWAFVVDRASFKYCSYKRDCPTLLYTPDCSKLVVHYRHPDDDTTNFFYVKAADGSFLQGIRS